ncbi:MAG: hypothetical protein ACKOQS_08650 [Dolichospermum sp.]
MMALSEDLQLSFDQKFANYQEERKMRLVTNIERRAIERTRKETRKQDITKLLQVRFGDIPENLVTSINQMTTEAPLGEITQLDDKKVALGQRLITLQPFGVKEDASVRP